MKKLIFFSVSIFFIIITIFVGLFAYSYSQLYVSLIDVQYASVDLEELSWSAVIRLGLDVLSGNWIDAISDLILGINLNLIFQLSNDGLLPVFVPDFSYDVLINDVSLGSGISHAEFILNPGETIEITTFQNIQKNSVSPILYSLTETEGTVKITVKGNAYFKLLWFSVPIPFESSKEVSIYDEINNALNAQYFS